MARSRLGVDGLGFVQQDTRNLDARNGRPDSWHLERLGAMTPRHLFWLFVGSGLIWAAILAGEVVIGLMV
jgi:hypothetical protein